MALWLELWSKGGAGPNFAVDEQANYVLGTNWIKNWTQMYFFNKVSDYLLTLSAISLLLYFLYFKERSFDKSYNLKIIKILFLISIIVLLEWFFNHPSLRYGGYFPISLIFFSTLLYILSIINVPISDKNKSLKKTYLLICFLFIFFNGKNIFRINFELNNYTNNFPFFVVEKKKHENILFKSKKIYSIANHYCWSTPTPCTNSKINFKLKNGYIFFLRQD